MTYEEREAAVWGELDAAEELAARLPDDERTQEILAQARMRARAFASECPACRTLASLCMRCRNLPPSPAEKGAPGRCVCGGRLRRTPEAWNCYKCGACFPDRRVAQQ